MEFFLISASAFTRIIDVCPKNITTGWAPLLTYSPTRNVYYSHVYIIYSPPAPNILSDLKQESFVVVSSSYCFITAMAASTDST